MKRIGALLLCSVVSVWGCGSSNAVSLRIAIAPSSSGENPLQKVAQLKQQGISRGIYFQFNLLKSPPSSINDDEPGATPFSQPDLATSAAGSEPLQTSYEVDTSTLNPTGYYRVTMLAINKDNTITHQGVSDCPMNIGLKGRNKVMICFGDVNSARVCTGTTSSFGNCPAL